MSDLQRVISLSDVSYSYSLALRYFYIQLLSTIIVMSANPCLHLHLPTKVANYGVGGQYEPHFDFSRVSFIYLMYVCVCMCVCVQL